MIYPQKLVLIRHAPVKKKEGFLPENDADAVINEFKIQKLAVNLPADSIWYVSPLKRTVQTAKALSKYVMVRKLIADANLVEQNFGDWAGKDISIVWKELKHKREKHNFSFICPEIVPPNGDSFLQQCKRVSVWLESLNTFESETVVVVAHAGTIRAVLSHMLGIEPDKAIGIEILHLSLNVIEVLKKEDDINRGGRFRLLALNKI